MSTPVVPTYIEHEYSLPFVGSIVQSFILTLIAELGDKTFIMLIILQYKTSKVTVLYSALIVELFMNFISMLMGLAIDVLLYKNLIDYLGIVIFTLYGQWLIGDSFNTKNQTFEKDIDTVKEQHEKKKKEDKLKSRKQVELQPISEEEQEDHNEPLLNSNLVEEEIQTKVQPQPTTTPVPQSTYIPEVENFKDEKDDENQPLVHVLTTYDEEHPSNTIDPHYFWPIMMTMAITECGDRTQFSSMSMAAIFNFWGVLVGSASALTLTVILGVYLGGYVNKILREKALNFILGLVFLVYAGEILYSKITS